MLPAVGQGVLAVEARRGERAGARGAAPSRIAPPRSGSRRSAPCSRGSAPTATCRWRRCAEHTARGTLRLRALLAASDGARILRAELEGAPAEAAQLGVRAAEAILREGGEALLAELRAEALA